MKRVSLIDNYDSFTYNLAQAFGALGAAVDVTRDGVRGRPTHVVISPGPGTPQQARLACRTIRRFAGRAPVLGVCLGHQCIAHVFGGRVVRADRLMHGKTSKIYHDHRGLFRGLSNPFEATRYHSLIVRERGLPKALSITAHTAEGEIMGLRHRTLPIEGVQFHPESILTPAGTDLLRNFLEM